MRSAQLRTVAHAVLLASIGGALPAIANAQAAGGAVPVVTLAEARRRAASVAPDAVAARSQVETAAWERRSALSNLLTPHLTAGGSYTHFSDPFFNFGTGAISPNATSATLDARYTLLGAGRIGNWRSARASLESAEALETAQRFRTALSTDAAYFAVLADRELARVAAERLRRANEQFGIARNRVMAGDAISSDSLQLLLELNGARLAVLRSDSAVATSRLRLGRRIGLAGPVEASSADTAVPPPLPLTEAEATAEMLARGPEVEASRAGERRASAALAAERERYLPEVTLGATTGAYDSELFPSALRRSQFAVTVSLPIWNGGERELTVARARAEHDVARATRADWERSAGELIAESYHGYQTSHAAIDLARVGLVVATENYRVQQARYKEGATTILDLLEAQVALNEAESALIQARYGTRLALAQIEALLGRRIFDASTTNSTDR